MLSGGKAGLVSIDVLRKEQEENRRRDKNNQPLEGWFSLFIQQDSKDLSHQPHPEFRFIVSVLR